MNLKNKKILITGAAVRIGRAICLEFASHGANIILHYNNSESEAKDLFAKLGGADKGHVLTRGDLTSQAYVKDLISLLGRVDILVNNASVFDPKPLEEETSDGARLQYVVNFWIPLTLMKEFRKQSLEEGLIINLLDQKIHSIDRNSGSYLLAKKSLADATRLAALQWAPEVRVNGVAPGVVLPPPWLPNSKMEKSIALIPMKKIPSVKEIANACIFLAENDSITGEIITLDGGQHLL